MIAILDYGIGNVSSIRNMLKKIGVPATITADLAVIEQAKKLILPGVGHFDYCMNQLKAAPFYDLLQQQVINNKVPVLGVCVGCQMLMESSEEGNENGLGWLKGKVIRFKKDQLPAGFKIPHMGWNDVHPAAKNGLYAGFETPRFYFVHSYHLVCDEATVVSATAQYGYEFTASVQQDNIMGVQFHPEKSHRFGMKLYENFVKNF
ncbi:imidazole glycerol phosphate synthase subunit HisH [Niastella caeni]|uniref:Imidazole glycerol phosphate synthase subunit HisH n=1 Tax=Niastella caeni TaxID=2569763 RepID=A0A4V4H1S3_9BACT|nr:imidazole glycerol phosphate synthase subunit HisH [Niastella caeni]THU41526.1 imidazole glycerol phosphate synthase subunit HisH [Niastella caeni]